MDNPVTKQALETYVNTYPAGREESLDIVNTKESDGYISRRTFVTFLTRVPVAYITYDREREDLHGYFIIS